MIDEHNTITTVIGHQYHRWGSFLNFTCIISFLLQINFFFTKISYKK
jgi:hypothetical protein